MDSLYKQGLLSFLEDQVRVSVDDAQEDGQLSDEEYELELSYVETLRKLVEKQPTDEELHEE